MIQKRALFLGYPTHSLTVPLLALLIFSGTYGFIIVLLAAVAIYVVGATALGQVPQSAL